MNTRRKLAAILAVAGICVGANTVLAKEVSLQSKGKVKGDCGASGGVYFPSSNTNKTWGCLNSDGGGIVCGGATKKQQKTCSTFKQAAGGRLPTRNEAVKAENK